MSEGFTYQKSEKYNGYIVYDNTLEPIIETLDYTSTLDTWNSKKNAVIALTLWFEFLEQKRLDFQDAETEHIPEFRTWLKTPPEYRRRQNIKIMHKEPHITNETWMQYQSRVSKFYEQYVYPKFPNCNITFKKSVPYSPYDNSETFIFKSNVKIVSPLTKAIPVDTILKIIACCTNERDKLLIEFFYKSGIRRGELFNIDKEQFKHVPRGPSHPAFTMYIHDSFSPDEDKQTKTGGREVSISTSLAERISGYIDNTIDGRLTNKNEHHEIFTALKTVGKTKKGDPLKGGTIYNIFKKAAKKAGFPRYTIHDCRHSFVTNMFSKKVGIKDAMDQTGHKNTKTLFGYRSKSDNVTDEVLSMISELDTQFKVGK
ncbi:MAG: site-specific integrase [Epsilonproteobacteria bacterium]|nr:site-specific integrase [Campylobacterota bacterium]